MDKPPLLFAPGESLTLAKAVATAAGLDVAPLEDRAFEGGEFKLRPLTSVRDRSVFVLQSLAGSDDAPVAHRLIRLLFLLMGLRDAGAARLVAVVPYFAFARKDRRTQLRDPVSARYVAQLLEAAGIAGLMTLDVHNAAALDNAFRIPVDHFSAIPLFVDHFATRGDAQPLAVVSPDVGGIKRAQLFRELLERRLGRDVGLAFVEKRRVRGEVSGGRIVGDVEGRRCVLIDDLCASGGTLIRAATALRAAGARDVHAAFTHAPIARGVTALLAAGPIAGVVTTDSAGCSTQGTVLPVGPLFGEAIARVSRGTSLASLFERWPP